MSQTATIRSLPQAFEIIKEMRAEGSRGLHGQAPVSPVVHFYAAQVAHFYAVVDNFGGFRTSDTRP